MSKPQLFYHASQTSHEIGEIWEPLKKEDWMGPDIGSRIEKFRPIEYTPRTLAVYMNETTDFSCHISKNYEFKYLVKPISEPTKHDNKWLGALQGFRMISKYQNWNPPEEGRQMTNIINSRYKGFPRDEKTLIRNYWEGVISRNPCLEWITDSVEIIKKISN